MFDIKPKATAESRKADLIAATVGKTFKEIMFIFEDCDMTYTEMKLLLSENGYVERTMKMEVND